MHLADRAEQHFLQGYNCAEAVLLAAVELYELGLDHEVVRLATGFGGGLGRELVCGALSGAILALGAVFGRCQIEQDVNLLKEQRERLTAEFHRELGSFQCFDLKAENKEDCVRCVRVAAAALEKVLPDLPKQTTC